MRRGQQRPANDGGPHGSVQYFDPEFDILSSADDDRSISGATDGSKYLVGFSTDGIVRSFLITGGGTVGQQASTGRKGSDPMVAFDGTNYLLAWTDQNAGLGGPSNVFGQLIDASGNKSGSIFRITTEGSVTLAGVSWGEASTWSPISGTILTEPRGCMAGLSPAPGHPERGPSSRMHLAPVL
jgi:hypothetical protein